MIYELRNYIAAPGKMPALLDRFKNHTGKLFAKHGIQEVGYWLNDIGGRSDELIYILAYQSLAHREQAWAAFVADPEWQKIKAETEKDGALVHHVTNQVMRPTDFWPRK